MDNFNNENGGMPQDPAATEQPVANEMPTQPAMGDVQPQFVAGDVPPLPVQTPMPPKKKANPGVIAGIIVAVVALVVCGILFIPKLFKSDKEVVKEALDNTFCEDLSDNYINELIGAEELAKAASEDGAEVSYKFVLGNVMGEDVLSGVALNYGLAIDPKTKLASGSMEALYNDESILTIEMYYDENNIYLGAPELIDGYFTLPTKDTLTKLANAPIMASEDVDVSSLPSVDFDLFAMMDQAEEMSKAEGESAIWEKAEVKKDGKASVDVNGTSVKAKKYVVSWAEEDIEAALTEIIDEVVEEVSGNDQFFAESGVTQEQFDAGVTQVKQFIPTIVGGDFIINVYIDGDKAVKLESTDSLNILGVAINYDFNMAINDDLSGKFAVDVMGEEVGITFNAKDFKTAPTGNISVYAAEEGADINFTTTVNGDDTNCDVTVAVGEENIATVNVASSFSKEDNSFSGDWKISINDDEVEDIALTYSGKYTDIEKGKSFKVVLDNLGLTYGSTEIFTCSFEMAEKAASGLAKAADSSLTTYDITTMTEDDFNAVVENNMDKINAWAEDAMTKLGDLATALTGASFGSDMGDIEVLEDEENADGEDDEVIDDINEAAEEITDDATDDLSGSDDTITDYSGNAVKILGSLDGFKFSYGCNYFVDYTDENYNTIEYTLVSDGMSMEEALESVKSVYGDSEGATVVDNQTVTVDGEEIHYTSVTFNDGIDNLHAVFVKPIADGIYLACECSFYNPTYTVEDLANALKAEYYEATLK